MSILICPFERANFNARNRVPTPSPEGEIMSMKNGTSGMLRHVALVRTGVSEELSASLIRVTRIGG
jgi:hypothetical protein